MLHAMGRRKAIVAAVALVAVAAVVLGWQLTRPDGTERESPPETDSPEAVLSAGLTIADVLAESDAGDPDAVAAYLAGDGAPAVAVMEAASVEEVRCPSAPSPGALEPESIAAVVDIPDRVLSTAGQAYVTAVARLDMVCGTDDPDHDLVAELVDTATRSAELYAARLDQMGLA